MENFFIDVVRSKLNSLANETDEFSLRQAVTSIEDEFRARFPDQNEESSIKKLWLNLMKTSVELENIELSILVVAKLKLAQLALLLRSTLQSSRDISIRKFVALSYVSSYLHLDNENQLKPPVVPRDRSINEFKDVIKLYINCGEWDKAIEFVCKNSTDDQHGEANCRLIYFKLAQNLESEENYLAALANYQKSGAQKDHLVRLLMKQHADSAIKELEKHCSDGTLDKKFWWEYRLFLSKSEHPDLQLTYNRSPDLGSFVKLCLLRGNLDEAETKLYEPLPERMRQFIQDVSPEKWFCKRKLDYTIAQGSSLCSNSRAALALMARQYRHISSFAKASSLLLCLNQIDLLLDLAPKFMGQPKGLDMVCEFGNSDAIACNLAEDLFRITNLRKKDELHVARVNQTLFLACIKLGLLNDAFQYISAELLQEENIITQAIEHLENFVEGRHNGTLDYVYPELRRSTLRALHVSLGGQISTTHVVSLEVLSLSILLFKFEPDETRSLEYSLEKLETMFSELSVCLNKLNFNASDNLVWSTKTLIIAIREKIDYLSECHLIREAFRQLVETIANRCMIESRYKSAASLYSQMGDSISAVKSLMRMGDVDIVINYSLLVRDAAVNRITMNYLKHLGVEQEVIDSFATKIVSPKLS